MLKIQIVSDTHLEFRNEEFAKILIPSAPILCLLGDICVCGNVEDFTKFKKFIMYLSTRFEYIFFITGNHEYYTAGNNDITPAVTIKGINKAIKKFMDPIKNVFFMNNKSKKITMNGKDYVFIGSTLWTYIAPDNRMIIEHRMNDYTYIYVDEKASPLVDAVRKFRVDDMVEMHNKSVKFIKSEIKKIKKDEIGILLTHHKPIKEEGPADQAYESDLANILIREPLKLAAYGHTHVKYDKLINNVRVVSNPKGYISQKTNYNPKFFVEL